MKRSLLAVLLVLPLCFLAVRSSPASGLPGGSVANRVCGSGAAHAQCTSNCCDKTGAVVLTYPVALGAGSNCGTAVDACLTCPACPTGETHCGGTVVSCN